MPAKRTTQNPIVSEHDDTGAVNAFIRALEHPLKPLIETVRTAILQADRSVTEGIKWNTVSFYRHGWFATINVRVRNGVQLILHHGAKVRDDSTLSQTIEDPFQLLTWLAKDRAIVTFLSPGDFSDKLSAFKKIIVQWVEHQAWLARLA